jgi:hypothetical protein
MPLWLIFLASAKWIGIAVGQSMNRSLKPSARQYHLLHLWVWVTVEVALLAALLAAGWRVELQYLLIRLLLLATVVPPVTVLTARPWRASLACLLAMILLDAVMIGVKIRLYHRFELDSFLSMNPLLIGTLLICPLSTIRSNWIALGGGTLVAAGQSVLLAITGLVLIGNRPVPGSGLAQAVVVAGCLLLMVTTVVSLPLIRMIVGTLPGGRAGA